MSYYHSHTIRVAFFPIKNHPKTSKASKLNQNWFASPGGCSSPPGSSSKTQKLDFYACVAWRYRLHRQAVHRGNPENHRLNMHRLAAMNTRQVVS